jgi:hypothetical protein
MPTTKENTRDQADRSTGDLRGQYRPIGIGAVAGALSATHIPPQDEPAGANSNERNSKRESLAA